jgi:antitoxin MazE
VEISKEGGKLIISPKKISLNELLEKVNTENMHESIETGASLGSEEW